MMPWVLTRVIYYPDTLPGDCSTPGFTALDQLPVGEVFAARLVQLGHGETRCLF
ncbi:hypothetical protein [Endozoicomonas sp. ALB091]|uniref:hypothetical protein n=1 Tax=Endozoicomonas sp. ALB091 TaxID=3403073 RepID=UPI003BB52128